MKEMEGREGERGEGKRVRGALPMKEMEGGDGKGEGRERGRGEALPLKEMEGGREGGKGGGEEEEWEIHGYGCKETPCREKACQR